MESLYTKDKTEYVPTRMNSDLLGRIDSYMKANEIWDRSKAIRELIELGLSSSTTTIRNRGQVIETEIIERTEKITRQRIVALENVKAFFPENLTSLLTFECDQRNAILRSKSWLDKEEWIQITHVVKCHNGNWIPNGDLSHWIIPLK